MLAMAMERSHDFLQVRCPHGMVGSGLGHCGQIAKRLFPERAMLLVRDGVEQRPDLRVRVVEPEIGRRQDRGRFAPALEQIGEDADQIARFLRVGRHKNLIFQQLKQLRRERPRLDEVLSFAILLDRGDGEQAKIFRNVNGKEGFDLRGGDLQPVLE
jgi:hypothetical protein